MLSPPRGHVRQRSVNKVERSDGGPKDDEPLLEEKEGQFKQQLKDYRALIFALWVASLVLTSLLTYVAATVQHGTDLGSFSRGYATDFGM